MTIYTGNICTIKLHKFIKKIRTHLLESSSIDTPVIELYIVGDSTKCSHGPDSKLFALTNYLMQLKDKCIIQLTFRGFIDSDTRMLFFTPFKKWVSQEVLDRYPTIDMFNSESMYLNNTLLKYKKLVGVTHADSITSLPLLSMGNIELI